jgi:pimeloyl-ACP methyl ester carboxylesterase
MKSMLNYIQEGSGLDVVLVHGFGESKEMWHQFIPTLSDYFRVTALDLGGFGESKDLLPAEVSIKALAEQVEKLIQSLGIKKFAWVGHSLGGYVGLEYAHQYPEKLWALSLFHSTALPDSEEKKKIRENIIDFIEKNGVAPFVENFVPPLFYENGNLKEEIEFVKSIAHKVSVSTFVEVTKAMRDRANHLDTLDQSKFPVQFIIGRQDNAVAFKDYATQIILPKNVDIQILDETGHMGMFERPAFTQKILLHFLKNWS